MASANSPSKMEGEDNKNRPQRVAPITGLSSFMSKFDVREDMQPVRKFDMYAFNKATDEHVARYDMAKLRPNGMVYAEYVKFKQDKEEIEKKDVSTTNFLSPANVHIFVDPDNPLHGGYTMVTSELERNIMVDRGYHELRGCWVSSIDQLPSRQNPNSGSAQEGAAQSLLLEPEQPEFFSKPAPADLVMPVGSIPPFCKKFKEEKYAVALVRMFEEKFLREDDDPLSPILQWDEARMTQNRIKNDSKFLKWCKHYCIVQAIRTGSHEMEKRSLEQISETGKQLEILYRENPFKSTYPWFHMAKNMYGLK